MLLDLQPTLQDDLVILRPLIKEDFKPLYQVASDPFIWTQHPCNDRYQEDVFKSFFDELVKSKGTLVIIDKQNNEIIGSTRFKRLNTTHNAIEIGWTFLSRKYWGGRYNKSIKHLMLNYAFETIDNVVFYIDKFNFRSQKAVEKIGAQQISGGTFENLLSDNQSNLTYLINRNQWKY